MSETRAEEITRLQREIGDRLLRLQYLVCGDQREVVSAQARVELDTFGNGDRRD